AFAGPRSLCPVAEALGFATFPAGRDGLDDPQVREIFARLGMLRMEDYATSLEANLLMAQVIFRINPQRILPDLVEIGQNWRPDLLVRETYEFGGCVAAELLGIAHATVGVGLYHPVYWQEDLLGRWLDEVRGQWG